MASSRRSFGPIITLVIGVLLLIVAIPDEYKSVAPSFLKPQFKLGLDLAGGTQLDFRISEDEIIRRKEQVQEDIAALEASGNNTAIFDKQEELRALEEQHANIVEAIRTVLERRINALGVSEATITPSYFGNEKHLLVDCPGVINRQDCIDTVGKTIQLEFKKQQTEASEEYTAGVRKRAQDTFDAIGSGTNTLQTLGQDLSTELGVGYLEEQAFFRSELPKGLDPLWNRKVSDPAIMLEGSTQQTVTKEDGSVDVVDLKGIYIAEVLQEPTETTRTISNPSEAIKVVAADNGVTAETRTQFSLDEVSNAELRTRLQTEQLGQSFIVEGTNSASVVYLAGRTLGDEEREASHILVAYKGATRADADVTRTKEEAKARAEELRNRLVAGEDFATLAREESDGPSSVDGGSLGKFGRGVMTPAFEDVAFALDNPQEISEVVETEFGYHIIKLDSEPQKVGGNVSYSIFTLNGTDAVTRATEALTTLQSGNVEATQEQITLRILFFSLEPTGWEDTELDGRYFRSAAVTVDTISGLPIVQIKFTQEGGQIFADLTRENVGKPIAIFVGGDLVSAPTVQQEITGGTAIITGSANVEEARQLAQDLNTGAIPAPIFLAGQRTIEATLGANALTESVQAAAVGIVILIVFMVLIYRLLGVIAGIGLLFYLIVFVAMLKLPILLVTDQQIVLSLAGMAGIILSLGMAVDANVLIFERMKEELQKGKTLRTAAETGFKRAWPSIRDGNVSTLITCAILFLIGTSIVRGFAITLSIGIVLSLFTAIVVTRWLIEKIAASPLGERTELFGIKKR